MTMAILSDYLDTYYGRDKILKTMSYVAKLATVVAPSKTVEGKIKIFSSKLSECRVILRLLDDIPTLNNAKNYGWGQQESDWFVRTIELLQIAVDIIYNPIEHFVWAGDNKIVSINSEKWDNVTTWFWIVSLSLSLLKSLRKVGQLKTKNSQINKAMTNWMKEKEKIDSDLKRELLACLCLTLDMTYAVSYLPRGILWGGSLQTWHVGALGTVSSCISLYQALRKKGVQKENLVKSFYFLLCVFFYFYIRKM